MVTDMLVRNMDLDVPVADARRLEVVVAFVGWRPIGHPHHSGVCVAK